MADWIDNYYELATFDAEGVSMGCRVKFPQAIEKTASDNVHFSVRLHYEDDEPVFDELSMHITGQEDNG
jgi:hypothetical protein